MISKKIFLLPCFLPLLLSAFKSPHKDLTAQKTFCDTLPAADSLASRVFEKVEVEASCPGGETAWKEFLGKTLNPKVPIKKRAPRGAYTVWVQFVVDKAGNLGQFKALTNQGYGMEDEVIRVLKKSPPWIPATQNGRAVKAYRKQPITFEVQ
jgi:protein TonB